MKLKGGKGQGLQVRWVEEQSTAGAAMGLKFFNANIICKCLNHFQGNEHGLTKREVV